jgi:hypothetical protein
MTRKTANWTCKLSRSGVGIRENLTDTFMVENSRGASGTYEDANPGANDQCFRMIHAHTIAADQFHHIRLERSSPLKGTNRGLETFRRHMTNYTRALKLGHHLLLWAGTIQQESCCFIPICG